MKYRTGMEKGFLMDLQLLAGENDGEDAGGGGPEGEEPDEDGEESGEEKKYSQKEMDAAVEKRLARERRKWKKQQEQNAESDAKDSAEPKEESEDVKARKAAEEKAGSLEIKVACYEAGVDKEAVDDVTALARAYMASDPDLDLEDAIEKVVKKYPHFKKGGEGEKKKRRPAAGARGRPEEEQRKCPGWKSGFMN